MITTEKVKIENQEDQKITVLTTNKLKPREKKLPELDQFPVVKKPTNRREGLFLTTDNFIEEVEKTKPKKKITRTRKK